MNRVLDLLGQWFSSPEALAKGFGILGFFTFGIGSYLGFSVLTNLGFSFFGAGVVAWGVNAMQRGDMTPFRRGFRVTARVNGFLARAWAVVLILGGLALLGYGILSILNPRSPMPATLRQFLATPQGSSILLLLGSTLGVLFSLTMIFVSDNEPGNGLVRFLERLPGRLIGLLLFVFFCTLAAAGLLQLFAPAVWQELVQAILQYLLQILNNL